MKKIILSMMAACAMFFATSCENSDVTFDNYDYQTVYFATQYPVRTITLGEDAAYPNEDDNQHKFQIKATLGGDRNLKSEHKIKIVVDNSLCDGLKYSNGQAVQPMPAEYYQLASDIITIPAGQIVGGVEVKLTDAYFADPKSLDVTYVVPIRMVEVAGNDSILSGTKKETVESPVLQNAADWNVAPQNYVLYAVKYKNPYHGCWISHGTDEIDLDGTTTTVQREAEYLEKNELRYLRSLSLTKCSYGLSTVVNITDKENKATTATLNASLILNIADDGSVTITSEDNNQYDVPGSGNGGKYSFTASGTGKWTSLGAKKAWGDKDRDLIELQYTVTYTYTDKGVTHVKKYTCKDNLVMQSRENNYETFGVTYNK